MKQLVYIAALALLAGTAMPAIAQQTPVGVWRLVSWAHALQSGGDVVEPWGPHPQGFISYTPGGRMSAVVTAPERKQPGATGQQAPAEDQARLYRTLFAYAGSYTVETEGVLVHHVEVASDPAWVGTNQRRFFHIEGNRLTITTPPLQILAESAPRIHTLVWERVE